jgi:hypothetical protein
MSDRLTAVRASRAPALWAVGIVLVFVVVAVACGLLWRGRVDVPSGVVVNHQWYPDPFSQGEQASFAATGWYVAIAVVAAFVLGVLAAWLSRAPEVLTLVAVLVGSLAAAWLMRTVGLHGAPVDPQTAAAHAADGTKLSGTIGRPGTAAFVTWPLAAVVPLAVVFLLFTPRPAVETENDVRA